MLSYAPLAFQSVRVPRDVVAGKGRDEVVGMVVALLKPVAMCRAGVDEGCCQRRGPQKLQKLIVRPLIDKDIADPAPVLEQQ